MKKIIELLEEHSVEVVVCNNRAKALNLLAADHFQVMVIEYGMAEKHSYPPVWVAMRYPRIYKIGVVHREGVIKFLAERQKLGLDHVLLSQNTIEQIVVSILFGLPQPRPP